MHPFDVSTAVQAAGPGRWTAEIDPGWQAPMGPNGGYLAAVVLRACLAAVGDPARAPRTLTLHYLRAPLSGPAEVEVTVERAGRNVTALSARLTQDGRLCVIALAAFAADLAGAADWASAPPAAPPFASLPLAPAPEGAPEIFHRLDVRPVFGVPMLSGGEEARTGGWLSFREPRAADALALATYVDAWWPAPFARLRTPIAAPTLELTVHFRARAGADGPVLGLFTSRTSAEGLFEEDAELWSAEGVLLAQSRQLALMRPL